MELYNLNKENLEEVNLVPFKLEKDSKLINDIIEKSIDKLLTKEEQDDW